MASVNYVDLLIDAIAGRRILGLELGGTLEQAELVLGADYVDDVHKRRQFLRRDYGLIELTFTGSPNWLCSSMALQVHRLASDDIGDIPLAIQVAYGDFPTSVRLDEFESRLADAGMQLAERGRDSDFARYGVDQRQAEVIVSLGGSQGAHPSVPGGFIWAISIWK